MARGIIAVKSGTGSGSMSNGKIIVTNGKTSQGSGLADGLGVEVQIQDQDLGPCNCGNIVDFTVTDVLQNGKTVKVATNIVASQGAAGPINNVQFVYDPTAPQDYTLGANDAMWAVIGGPWSGSFTVNGGTLIVTSDPSALPPAGTYNALTGTLTVPTDGSVVVVDNQVSIQSDNKIDSNSDIYIRRSELASTASIVLTKKPHVIIRNTNVKGTVNAN
ncbi:MAG TPA: hypothetical protein PLD02_16520 [Saprospiraceae bacterium]|nr:hypothetical protein [Saprospiraceae bacterium]